MTKSSEATSKIKTYLGLTGLILIAPVFFLPISSGTESIAHFDKLIHFFFHLVVTTWFIWAKEKLKVAASISAVYGILIEILQPLTTTRSFDLLDIGANLLGAFVAVMIARFLYRRSIP